MTVSSSLAKASAFGITLLLIGGIAVPMFSPLGADANHTQCSDGTDNDNDGRIDYPQDADCSSIDDGSEGAGTGGVFVSVTDGRDEVTAGDSLTYIITLRQDRDSTVVSDVSFHLPAQARVQSASDGGSLSTTSVSWRNVTVYRGATKTLTVTVYVDPNAEQNQLIVARATADGSQSTDTTLIRNSSTPYPTGRVTVSISDRKSTVQPGEVLEYEVIVRNPTNRTVRDDVSVNVGANLRIEALSDGGVRSGTNGLWRDVVVGANSTVTLRFRGIVEPHDRRMAFVDASARYGTATSVDRTVINSSEFPSGELAVSITDGMNRANRSDLLTYTVRVTNRSSAVESHGFITAALPLYSQFVSATDGGVYDGNNVRWSNMVIPGNDSREVRFSVRVRRDAPRNAVLSASATVKGGASAEDRTGLDDGSFTYDTGRSYGSILAVGTPDSSRLVFRKTADRAEVLPGDVIRYTVYVQNRFDTPLTNVRISDRFNTAELTLVGVSDNADVLSGRLEWRIPVLAPGETWQTTYTLAVRPDIARGITVTNNATISADQVGSRTDSDAVYTLRTAVINGTPNTGASDFLSALEDTSRLLTPMGGSAAAGATTMGTMLLTGIGAGLRAGKKFL